MADFGIDDLIFEAIYQRPSELQGLKLIRPIRELDPDLWEEIVSDRDWIPYDLEYNDWWPWWEGGWELGWNKWHQPPKIVYFPTWDGEEEGDYYSRLRGWMTYDEIAFWRVLGFAEAVPLRSTRQVGCEITEES